MSETNSYNYVSRTNFSLLILQDILVTSIFICSSDVRGRIGQPIVGEAHRREKP